jgi:hypothetical protein
VRKTSAPLVAVGVILFSWHTTASTLAPTQLKGLRGVNVAVKVTGSDQAIEALKEKIQARIERRLGDAGLLLTSSQAQWFYFEVQAAPVSSHSGGAVALLISARLREPVQLKRDPGLPLADDGVTWAKHCVKVSSQLDLTKTVEETLDYYVGEFADHWKLENPEWARASTAAESRPK